MASLSQFRTYLRRFSIGQTTLKSVEGVKVTIKGIATDRSIAAVVNLALTADVSVKMPPQDMGAGTVQSESFKPSGEYAKAAVAALLGEDAAVLAGLEPPAVVATVQTEAAPMGNGKGKNRLQPA